MTLQLTAVARMGRRPPGLSVEQGVLFKRAPVADLNRLRSGSKDEALTKTAVLLVGRKPMSRLVC